MIKQAIITHYRTEEAKAYRPSPFPWSNCISTVTKDNLLWQQYE